MYTYNSRYLRLMAEIEMSLLSAYRLNKCPSKRSATAAAETQIRICLVADFAYFLLTLHIVGCLSIYPVQLEKGSSGNFFFKHAL